MKKSIIVQSPGRINIIGEHTDYHGGFVLPAAVDKKTVFELKQNGTASTVNMVAKNVNETYSFDLQSFVPLDSGWQNYVMGVVSELQKLGASMTGFDASFEGDVPIGSGMSSSAALECSLAFGLNELFELGFDKLTLVKASQLAEHNFVGIKSGIMDQFSSMMGKKDHVMLLDCRSLDYEYFPLEMGEFQLLLINSNVSHALASSEYNTRREESEQAIQILAKDHPDIKSLRDLSMDLLLQYQDRLPEKLYRRCKHVVTENQRVLDATKAMNEQDIPKVGELLYQSHRSLQFDYEVSCPEIDFLVDETIEKDYVLGSRIMGGGFGGCTINIVKKEHVEQLLEEISAAYRAKFNLDITPYKVSIEDGTSILQD